MKIVSWNLNGLNATMKNCPFNSYMLGQPYIVCFNDIRTSAEPEIFPGYYHFWNHAQKSGYAGTALLSKTIPRCML